MATTTEKVLIEIDIEGGSSIAKIAALRKETDALKEANKKLREEAKADLENGAKDAYDAKIKLIVANEAAIKNLSATSRNYQNVLELQTKSNQASADSYEQVLRRQQLAQITLKNLEGTLKKNSDGTYELTDAYKAASKEVLQAKEAVLKFDAGIKDGRTNVGNYTASFVEAINQTGLFGGKLDMVAQGFSKLKEGKKAASDLVSGLSGLGPAASGGASAMNLLKIAIASTGIGLLLIALGSLAAYFSSTDEGANKLKVAFAAVGQVVNGIVSAFAKLGDFLLNSGKVWDTFTSAIASPIETMKKAKAATAEFIEEQTKLAKIAMDNARAEIEYEKSLIKSTERQKEYTRQAEDYRTASNDKTLSDKERIASLKKAGEFETLALKEEQVNSAKRFQIAQNDLELAKKRGNGIIDAEKKLSEAREDYLNVRDAIDDKHKDIKSESSKLELQAQKDYATATIQLLDNELKQKQLKGEEDIALQKQIALKKYEELKKVEGQSYEQLKALKSNYELEIATIDKQAADNALEVQKNIEDLSIASIEDKLTREIATEALVAQRKIELLKGSEAEIAQQKELILIDSQNKINAIVAENDAKELADTQKQADELKNIDDDKTKNTLENAAKVQAVEQARLDVAKSVINGLQALLSQDEKARKKYGDALKALAIAEIGINLAKQLSAIAATTAALGPFGTPIAAAQSIQAIIGAAVNTALVARQKFAKGGVFGGKSHQQGGTVGHFSDGTSVEVEKDEAFFVINKRSTAMINNLSRLNQAGGGVKFADGGTTSNYVSSGAFSNGDLQSFLADLLVSLPSPVVVVQDINEVQSRTAQVVERSVL